MTFYLGYEATQTLTTKDVTVSTPISETTGKKLSERVAIVPVMRAGLGMLDPMLDLIPSADVHHIGMYRVKESLLPIQYYNKLPKECNSDVAYILDPMIATAGTLNAVVGQLKKWGCPKIHVVAVLASAEGLAVLKKSHPDVTVTVAAVDKTLENGKIVPGLGDAGDRLYVSDHLNDHDESLVSEKKRKASVDVSS